MFALFFRFLVFIEFYSQSVMRQRSHKSGSKAKESGQEQQVSNNVVQTRQSTSPPASRCKRCIHIGKYFILVLIIPPFLNYASLHQEARVLQPPGALYDIGYGQKMFLNCEGSGQPTVLLDAPTGQSSDVWSLVQKELAKITKVCVYDRAGLGWSERPPMNYSADPSDEQKVNFGNKWRKSTVERMVDDLHKLVSTSSQQEKPFIFVGAELGAMIGRFYAQVYESEISDLVLVDPVVEDLFEQDQGVWADLWFGHLLPYFQAHQISAALGASRLALLFHLMAPPLAVEDMPAEVVGRQKHLLCNPRHLSAVVDEYHFVNDSISQMQTVFMMKAFPSNISITVINGNYFDDQLPSALNKAWAKSQQTLLSQLHPHNNHIVVNGADHHMMYRHPRAIIDPVRRIIQLRQGKNKHSQTR